MVSATNILPERLLLDALERIERKPDGFLAIHMHFSRLRPNNKGPKQIRVLARMFDPIVNSSQSRLFALGNGDIIVIGRYIAPAAADEVVLKIRDMLQGDPLIYDSPEDDFSTIYDIPKEFNKFYQTVEKLHKEAKQKQQIIKPKETQRSLEPEDLDEVLEKLETIDVADIIRRQSGVSIHPDARAEVAYQEYFTSMMDLKKRISSEINLLSDRWLFQHLSETLDKKMFEVLKRTKLFYNPPALSLNLNISTVFSKEFASFAKSVLSGGQKIIVEVQLMDVFQNVQNYIKARDLLHKGGHKILIDSLPPITFQFLDLHLLKPDLVKIFWSKGLADENQSPKPKDLIKKIGPDKVILARIDEEEGMNWGISVGIKTFQGYFIDAMNGAMTKSRCKHSSSCTLAQCVARRSAIAGSLRAECPNPKMLDASLDITS